METNVEAKAVHLGIIGAFGYFSTADGRVRLRPAGYGVYISVTGDLHDTMMNSETFDSHLYHMLHTVLELDMLTALRMCLS